MATIRTNLKACTKFVRKVLSLGKMPHGQRGQEIVLNAGRMFFKSISPKLPMHDKQVTRNFYVNMLGFREFGSADFEGYLMVEKDNIQIHFFEFEALDPNENYGQVYIRTNQIDQVYRWMMDNGVSIHPAGHLQVKPWGQKEFSILDPDNNLLTFGQSLL
jgi:catechol 2,3-dioxygenase-like lactoylglutathione lyase family enzyme